MIHELPGFRLRMPEVSDVDDLYRIKNDIEVAAPLVGFSRGYSRTDLNDWLEAHRKRSDEILWILADPETDRCIGHIGLYQIDHRIRKAAFGILIDRRHWGRGVGREATLFAIRYGFRVLALERIELSVLATNERAIRIYRKLGFIEEGRLRRAQVKDGAWVDVVLMAILLQEFRPDAS